MQVRERFPTEGYVITYGAAHDDHPHDHRTTVVTEIDDTRGIDRPSCIVGNCTFEGTPLSLRRHLIRFHGIRFQRAAQP
ncbi:hypothetical protein PR003_g29634 [Phytophthora rubi]|uniref:Uncharacterized protein n=1 Tax=Phytophthora rubi TaxID=129364 RepID=A0A6A4BHQ9_9STRA|nr:hypothetical protein PR003_g29634 [Phytophthora rubi]